MNSSRSGIGVMRSDRWHGHGPVLSARYATGNRYSILRACPVHDPGLLRLGLHAFGKLPARDQLQPASLRVQAHGGRACRIIGDLAALGYQAVQMPGAELAD